MLKSRAKTATPRWELRARDYTMAEMLVQGEALAVIAQKCRFRSVAALSDYRRVHPEIAQLEARLRAELEKAAGRRLRQLLAEDAPKTAEFLQDVRDGRYQTCDQAAVRNQLFAAATLARIQFPKQVEVRDERTMTFVFEDRRRQTIEETLDSLRDVTLPALPAPDTLDA